MVEPKRTDEPHVEMDDKLADPLIRAPVDRRYNVNWAEHTESDGQYLLEETRKWWRKEKAR